MNETFSGHAEGLHGRRAQLALAAIGVGTLAVFLVGEPWFGVPWWVIGGMVALSLGLSVTSWIYRFVAGSD